MKVLIDTNVLLDVFTARKPFVSFSEAVLDLCEDQISGAITASQTTDIYYLLRRNGLGEKKSKDILRSITTVLKVLPVTKTDVNNALNSCLPDFEDSLLESCAARYKAEYILTRDRDFSGSLIPAITPKAFLEKFFSIT